MTSKFNYFVAREYIHRMYIKINATEKLLSITEILYGNADSSLSEISIFRINELSHVIFRIVISLIISVNKIALTLLPLSKNNYKLKVQFSGIKK